MASKPSEEFKFPDGSQLTFTTLNKMGVTSGDIGEVMRQFYRDPDPEGMRNIGIKGAALMGDKAEQDHEDTQVQEAHQEDERLNQQRQENERRLAKEAQDQRFFDEKREAEERRLQEKIDAEKRAENEQANQNLLSGAGRLFGFAAVVGLAPAALSAAGDAMSPAVSALAGPMMVATNNNGSMLKAARGGFDILGPGGASDIRLTGPNQTAMFTPGEPLPGMTPSATPGMGPKVAAASPFDIKNPLMKGPSFNGMMDE